MRYRCWMLVLAVGAVSVGLAQPFRTPHGLLWAGTIFELRAIATDSRETLLFSLSAPARVSVGAIYHWSVIRESPSTLTLSGNEGWFALTLKNNSNAVDALSVHLKTFESADATPWTFTLFEQTLDASDRLVGVTNETAPFFPCETRRLWIRAWPPANRNTDGVFVHWLGTSRHAPELVFRSEFAAGVEAAHGAHTIASTGAAQQIVGEPVLIQGRLYWLTWNGQQLFLFRTPNPLQRNSTFVNNVELSARINAPAPTHHTIVIGSRWYVLTQSGRIVFFELGAAQNGVTLNAQPLNLPPGISASPTLPLAQVGNLLAFADQHHRVWVHNPAPPSASFTMLPASSAQPITVLCSLDNSMLAVGRSDGRVDVYRYDWNYGTVALELQGLCLPLVRSQPVRFVTWRDGILVVASNASVGAYQETQRKWLWVRTLDSALAAEPVHDPLRSAIYLLTVGGWLHGLERTTGKPLPLYPQHLFAGVGVARAALGCIARRDRGVPYLYIQAQLSNAQSNSPTMRVMFVTARNPLNRFVFPLSLTNVPIGSRWLFTGDTDQDLALCWIVSGGGADQTRGVFYGFLMR